MGYKYPTVPINSNCPASPDRLHKWVTRRSDSGKSVTWCEFCKAAPK